MALTSRDYQAVLSGTIFGTVSIKNVFYFQADTAGGSANDIANLFDSDLATAIATVQNIAVMWDLVEVVNLTDLADFASIGMSVPGARSGECTPPFNAWAFQYVRPTRAVRHGWKRFAGVTEGDSANGLSGTAMLTVLNTLAANLAAVTDMGAYSYYPCIAKTVEVPLSSDPTKTKYVPQTLFPAQSVQYVRISSQVSRKL